MHEGVRLARRAARPITPSRVPTPSRKTVVTSFFPHMHLRAKAFRYELIYPGGGEETILDIPRYDFNWQLHYKLREPKLVPKGTVLRSTGWYDNSAATTPRIRIRPRPYDSASKRSKK